MKEDSATGPDMLPTKILRECADVLAKPFRMMALLILHQGVWPKAWMKHWIVPRSRKARYTSREITEGAPYSASIKSNGTVSGIVGFLCL